MTAPIAEIARIMDSFAERTGVTSHHPPRRYLWTDAFAVCNYLALHVVTGDARWTGCAATLIHQVHHVLGQHRADDTRTGWISGLPDAEGERRPLAGGLRIGKPLPERPPGEPLDERLEWDRDGQYYHYLTRWLHALRRTAGVIGDAGLLRHAAELATAAYRGFSHPAAGGMRLYWKMSIDLSRPAVKAMGEHDALDALVSTAAIVADVRHLASPGEPDGVRATTGPGFRDGSGTNGEVQHPDWPGQNGEVRDPEWPGPNGEVRDPEWPGPNGEVRNPESGPDGEVRNPESPGPNGEVRNPEWPGLNDDARSGVGATASPPLREGLAGLAGMCAGRGWATSDALGIGGLLTSALQLARLGPETVPDRDQLLGRVLHDAARSLDLLTLGRFPAGDAEERLAFRELGLAIGLAATERLQELCDRHELPGTAAASVGRLARHLPIRDSLNAFWLEPRHQRADCWVEHRDINEVMLATSLLPDGYLG